MPFMDAKPEQLTNTEDDEIQEDKLLYIKRLMESIKNKTERIKQHTNLLNILNYKLEALSCAFNAYSEEVEGNDEWKENKEKKIKKNETKEEKDVYGIINGIFIEQKGNKSIAIEIYKLLESNGITGLDEIVRQIKQSKYRIINVLNILVRERIILKYFEKGFNYKLNKE